MLLLAAPGVAVTAVHVALFATPRFSHPAEPALLALAALALWDRLRPQPSTRPWATSSSRIQR